MQYGQRLVFRHIDLVEHAEAAVLCAEVYRPRAEAHLAALEGIHTNEARGVHIHMEGNITRRTAEDLRKVFRQHVFARGLAAGEQQILPAQNGGDRRLPHVLSVIAIPRLRHAVRKLRGHRVLHAKFPDAVQKRGTKPLLFQKIQQSKLTLSAGVHRTPLFFAHHHSTHPAIFK